MVSLEEVWKDISNYEGFYQVSNLGRIKSLDRWVEQRNGSFRHFDGRVLKPRLSNGYLYVSLSISENVRTVRIHSVVAQMFIKSRPEGMVVNHKDEVKTNNCIDNLEYLTVKENTNYGTGIARMRLKKINGKKSKPIIGINIKTQKLIEFPSMREAQRNGFDERNISKCCNGKANSHKGYRWEFA